MYLTSRDVTASSILTEVGSYAKVDHHHHTRQRLDFSQCDVELVASSLVNYIDFFFLRFFQLSICSSR